MSEKKSRENYPKLVYQGKHSLSLRDLIAMPRLRAVMTQVRTKAISSGGKEWAVTPERVYDRLDRDFWYRFFCQQWGPHITAVDAAAKYIEFLESQFDTKKELT